MTEYKLYPNLPPSVPPEALGPPLCGESSDFLSSQRNSG